MLIHQKRTSEEAQRLGILRRRGRTIRNVSYNIQIGRTVRIVDDGVRHISKVGMTGRSGFMRERDEIVVHSRYGRAAGSLGVAMRQHLVGGLQLVPGLVNQTCKAAQSSSFQVACG
ncbi:hypothetical protein PP1Y_Mpl8005 (plasmid) [Novosphingobium sp. PP1Y]|nr:hypothetical protein PP1Y_Mpl8005 [Novosphingobium sp. PP1Y]